MRSFKKNLAKYDDIWGNGAVYLTDGIIMGTAYAFNAHLENLRPRRGNELYMDDLTAVVCGSGAKRESAITALKFVIAKIEATPEEKFNLNEEDLPPSK